MSNLRLNNGYELRSKTSLTFPTTIDGSLVTEVRGFATGPGIYGGRSYTYIKGDAIEKICSGAFSCTDVETLDFPNCK